MAGIGPPLEIGTATLAVKVNGCRIASTDYHTDVLARSRAIAAAHECGQCRCPTGLRHDSDRIPKHLLSQPDILIRDQENLGDMGADDRESPLAHTTRSQRVGGDAVGLGLNRAAGPQRGRQGGRKLGLDPPP